MAGQQEKIKREQYSKKKSQRKREKSIKSHSGSITKEAEEHFKELCKGHISENRKCSSKTGFDCTN